MAGRNHPVRALAEGLTGQVFRLIERRTLIPISIADSIPTIPDSGLPSAASRVSTSAGWVACKTSFGSAVGRKNFSGGLRRVSPSSARRVRSVRTEAESRGRHQRLSDQGNDHLVPVTIDGGRRADWTRSSSRGGVGDKDVDDFEAGRRPCCEVIAAPAPSRRVTSSTRGEALERGGRVYRPGRVARAVAIEAGGGGGGEKRGGGARDGRAPIDRHGHAL